MKRTGKIALLLLLSASLTACGRLDGSYYAENRVYADYDVAKELWIDFENNALDLSEPDPADPAPVEPNCISTPQTVFLMRVVDGMNLYESPGAAAVKERLPDESVVELTLTEETEWAQVRDTKGNLLGYAKDGFAHAVDSDCRVMAQLPIVYGEACGADGKMRQAYSHLVDLRQYLHCYSSVGGVENADLSDYDVVISMQLSTGNTNYKKPFYSRNLCMVQYDLIPQIRKAAQTVRKDGYTLVINDAYRPTAVQGEWYRKTGNTKYVRDPLSGMGGIHDRGTALDVSLLDAEGKPVEMPTAIYTFSSKSARNNASTGETAKRNMEYLQSVMRDCGFVSRDADWWHFEIADSQDYLPLNVPIDDIPTVTSEE